VASAQTPLPLTSAVGSRSSAPECFSLPDAELAYLSNFYDAAACEKLLRRLLAETPWRQDTINFGGKAVAVPRLQAWYGDRHYGYSGLKFPPLPWTDLLLDIRDKISTATQLPFNSVLLNYYRNGNDSVAWHSDDEHELGPDPLIASLSLGAARRFELKHRTLKRTKLNLWLDNGSLLLMGTGLQQNWQHQLPKDAGVAAPRINLTFRFIR
jgi:alkylated DNA repair dioxygenase AlkB